MGYRLRIGMVLLICSMVAMGYSRQNPNRRVEWNMEFPQVLREQHVEISGVN